MSEMLNSAARLGQLREDMIKPLRVFLFSASLILLFNTRALADPIITTLLDGTTATVITFESATTANVGNPIGSFYAAHGVTFSNAQFTFVSGFTPITPYNFPFGGMTFGGIIGPTSADPIVIRFSSLQSWVSLTAVDISREGYMVRTYDANGNQLGGPTGYAAAGPSFPNMSTVGQQFPNISYIEIYQPLNTTGSPGGVIFDRLSFSQTPLVRPVPEPASLVLLGLGLSGAASAIARRRKKNDH